MLPFLIFGLVLGMSAGLSPGPLLTLVISQTLKHGVREGIHVALAPLITDVPVIVLATVVLARLANAHAIIGLISLAGGIFVLYLAYGSFRTTRVDMDISCAGPQSLSRGAIVNALNPHPYLFWLTVGGPTMIKAWMGSPCAAAAFVMGFYGCLVGAKAVIAVLAGRSRQMLMGNTYGYVMRILGTLLLIFALVLFRDALNLLGFRPGILSGLMVLL